MDVRDIVLEQRSGNIIRISELHSSYLPMQYPLLLHMVKMDITEIRHSNKSKGVRHMLTIKDLLSYRIFDRESEAQTIVRSRKLFQQFLVDGYMMMESQRLPFITRNQKMLRADNYRSLEDAIHRGTIEAGGSIKPMEKRVVLPSSFVGGP